MNVYRDKKNKCCGCTACQSSCPLCAITMETDDEGFVYPVIDENRCVRCGKCEAVCPIFSKAENESFSQKIYAVRHKNKEIVKASSSGGIFTALSDAILERGGVVYATILSDSFEVCYRRADNKDERNRMRGSKYVQSNLGKTFIQIKEDLEQNKEVLFVGSSCYCAGLLQYLKGSDTSKLLTCDFVCHGVPSPLLWKEYIHELRKDNKEQIIQFQFRNKSKGWRHNHYMIEYPSKTIYEGWGKQKWNILFGKKLAYRPVCYECSYASFKKPADITMGDFFRIAEFYPDFDDNTGVSLLMTNTEKGVWGLKVIEDAVIYREVSQKMAWQPNLEHPSVRPKEREAFWNDYQNNGFRDTFNRYTKTSLRVKIEWNIVVPLLQKIGCYHLVMRIIHWIRRKKNL